MSNKLTKVFRQFGIPVVAWGGVITLLQTMGKYPQLTTTILRTAGLSEVNEDKSWMVDADADDVIVKQYEDELVSLKGQIKYCKDQLKNPNLQNWEKKEYQNVIKDCIDRTKTVQQLIKKLRK